MHFLGNERVTWPSVSVQYVVPLSIISYTYITISTRLWWSAPPGIQTPGQDRETLLRKRKIVQMLILVVVIFSLCWLPYHLYFIVSMCRPEINEFKYINLIFLVSHWLAMSNSCYNPIIYGVFSVSYKGVDVRTAENSANFLGQQSAKGKAVPLLSPGKVSARV